MNCSRVNQTIFVAGWTERIIYQLTHDNVTFDISGMTVALVGENDRGVPVNFTTVGIETAATSKVYFDPSETDLKAEGSPLRLRWSLTDGSGKTAFFPRAEPLVWTIETPSGQ